MTFYFKDFYLFFREQGGEGIGIQLIAIIIYDLFCEILPIRTE